MTQDSMDLAALNDIARKAKDYLAVDRFGAYPSKVGKAKADLKAALKKGGFR